MQKKSPSSSAFLSPRASIALPLCAAIFLIVTGTLLAFLRAEGPPAQTSQRTLTFEERISYQRAIEEVYWRHRIWPKERKDPKPSLDAVMSQAQLENKVKDYLRNSQALEDYWQRPITAEQLQAEMDRMATHTKQPEVLQELFEALGNDPFVIAECLARPALAERLLTSNYTHDQRIHGELKQRAEAELQAHPGVGQMKQLSGKYSEIALVRSDSKRDEHDGFAAHSVRLNSHDWDETVQRLVGIFSDSSVAAVPNAFGAAQPTRLPPQKSAPKATVSPAKQAPIAQIKTGVLSSLQEDDGRYYATAVVSKTNDRLKLATVSWLKEPLESWLARIKNQVPAAIPVSQASYALPKISDGATCTDNTWTATAAPPEARELHTVVWTGSEMIVWGGQSNGGLLDTGGRYTPATDTWTFTNSSGAPTGRSGHTAVWTGNEMIVWGGQEQESPFPVNTGGKYNPGTDSWTPTNTTNAPDGRYGHTAVWSGSQMVIWGGSDIFNVLNTGGRYDPTSDSWTATSTTNAPEGRQSHTAVWTGSVMIIWGGEDQNFSSLNTGGRYNPNTDTWTPTSLNNAPDSRYNHTAVSTDSEMIVWGGFNTDSFQDLNTGGRYNPNTDSWTATNDTAPDPRERHTAVWTGTEMVIWGGESFSEDFNTGGRYNPGTDSWSATSATNAPEARDSHTAVWTGNEMIVWGGFDNFPNFTDLNTGGRYDPGTNSWTATNTYNVPDPRSAHTAVWTGSEMIVWGGTGLSFPSSELNTGGRYDLATDSWVPTTITDAPSPRNGHTAVWSGTEMIVWGGSDGFNDLNTGGKYNPGTDSWIATTGIAPLPRTLHTAVWTGREMIVWGGSSEFGLVNTGGRYNPVTDIWTATSTNAPDARDNHTAVWADSQMIVWGGDDANSNQLSTGGRYDPATDSWTSTSTINAPSARDFHTAVWTASEMIVWGGSSEFSPVNTGGRYNPVTDTWVATTSNNAPDGRDRHTAVWTGTQMIIWGGDEVFEEANTGGQYVPDTDTWTATSLNNAPSARESHTAVWTGSETGSAMIVWGGNSSGGITNTGGSYCAQGAPIPTPTPTPTPTPRPPRATPTPRVPPGPHPRPTPR
jgi:N-acetylneuraminic acid mutarotase